MSSYKLCIVYLQLSRRILQLQDSEPWSLFCIKNTANNLSAKKSLCKPHSLAMNRIIALASRYQYGIPANIKWWSHQAMLFIYKKTSNRIVFNLQNSQLHHKFTICSILVCNIYWGDLKRNIRVCAMVCYCMCKDVGPTDVLWLGVSTSTRVNGYTDNKS